MRTETSSRTGPNGVIIFVVGVVIAAAVIGIAATGALTQIGLPMSNWSNPSAWQAINWHNLNYNALAPYIAAIIGGLSHIVRLDRRSGVLYIEIF